MTSIDDATVHDRPSGEERGVDAPAVAAFVVTGIAFTSVSVADLVM